MKYNHFSSIIAAFSCLLVLGCSETDELTPQQDQTAFDIGKPASVEVYPVTFDPVTNTYTGTNFNEYEFEWVDELPDPNTLESSNGRQNVALPGGQIKDVREVIIPTGGVSAYEQRAAAANYGYVVTGIGATINSSNNNYSSLVLEYRLLSSNGTLGSRKRIASGANLEPTQLEAWYSVPEGAVVWGVGVNGKYDVKNLVIRYKYVNSSARLGTSYYTVKSGTDTNLNPSVDYLPDPASDQANSVVLGLGLTATSGGTTRMVVDVGTLK